MKFLTSFQSDEEKLAKKQRALELELQEFERLRSVALRRDFLMNQVDERKAQFSRLCDLLDKGFGYSEEMFLHDFLNHGLTVENVVKFLTQELLKSRLPTLKSKLEKKTAEPSQAALDDFLRENKAALAKLPKADRKPEPPFAGQKLPEDFITSGASAALVKKYQ